MKQRTTLLILICCVMLLAASKIAAQTVIPDTAELRKARVHELEQNQANSPAELRELAMIHAVMAGLDNPTLEAATNAVKILEKAEKANPKDFELMSAHGSVLTMMARFQKKTAQQLRYTKKGFRKMDRALKKDPDNIGALLQRANNSLKTPVFLKRTHYAKRDFQRVLELVGDRKGPGFKAMILYQLGDACELMKEDDNAQQQWQKASQLNAGYWSEQALAKLNQ